MAGERLLTRMAYGTYIRFPFRTTVGGSSFDNGAFAAQGTGLPYNVVG